MLPPSKLQFNGADIWFGGEQPTSEFNRPAGRAAGSQTGNTAVGSSPSICSDAIGGDLDKARWTVRMFIQSKTQPPGIT
jgi:hypothetical protein